VPEGGFVRNFDAVSDEQRFYCVGKVLRVMAETYLLFDGFDVAVRDWRCRSPHPTRLEFDEGPHRRSWRLLAA
jgi:hypothetical protein